MVTLANVYSYLDGLVADGSIMDYDIVDEQELKRKNGVVYKIIINVIIPNGSDVYDSANYVLLVRNKGTPDEQVFWNKRKLKKIVSSDLSNWFGGYKKTIKSYLRKTYNVVIFSDFHLDDRKNVVWVEAFCDNGSGVISAKKFAVVFHGIDTYDVYEVSS